MKGDVLPGSRARGFSCPECGERKAKVVDSRQYDERVRRRYECPNGHRYTTYEYVHLDYIPMYEI